MAGRDERLQWCKDRALEYLPASPADALTSFMSDAGKPYEDQPNLIDWTKPAMQMLTQLGMMHAMRRDAGEMERWIKGFN